MTSDRERRIKKFRGAKIYQIFIDRFAGCIDIEKCSIDVLKRHFVQGNLSDINDDILNYIKSMGFNVIWLTPFYVNQPNGNHGYHVINYNHVDPRFAFGNLDGIDEDKKSIGDPLNENDVNIETEADKVLKKFVEACHKKGMMVMMDFVPNHCHDTHPFFIEAKKNNSSEYRNWFYFNNDNINYLQFLHVGELPKLNLSNPEVRAHLINSTKKFLKYKIDAVRVDHCIGPNKNDLNEIIEEIHKTYPDVPFIGEILPFGCQEASETIYGIEPEKVEKFRNENFDAIEALDEIFLDYHGVLDGVLDFSFQYNVDKFVSGFLDEEGCIKRLNDHFSKYKNKKDFLLLKNIDSHDCDRIMYRCHNDIDIQQKALEFLYKDYCERNDPLVVYYGTEDLMTQNDTIRRGSYGDYRCRQPMRFIYKKQKSIFK